MEQASRVAVISIIVSREDAVERLNAVLHSYAAYVVGRMGIPYRSKGVNIICVALDAPQDVINALGGRLGALPGVNAKTSYAVSAVGLQDNL